MNLIDVRCLGEFDCMDMSDERKFTRGMECAVKFDTFLCDERICYPYTTSCGDGHCVMLAYLWDYSTSTDWSCLNMRERNYLCEITTAKQLWTMENGMCYPFPNYDDPNDLNHPNLTRTEKCTYLAKCALSRGFERDCPCNQKNCSTLMREICDQNFVLYPTGALYAPHLYYQYKIDRDWRNIAPDSAIMNGCIKCRGYRVCHSMSNHTQFYKQLFRTADYFACKSKMGSDNTSIIQYDKHCWNGSRTFNGLPYAIADVCSISRECISTYRLLDQAANCIDVGDEKVIGYGCDVNVRKHRFQCSSNNFSRRLPVWRLGNGERDCVNGFDEYINGSNFPIAEIYCKRSNDSGCQILRQYISKSSLMNTSDSLSTSHNQSTPTAQIPFHHLCNSFWDLSSKIDEFTKYCQQWICSTTDFQCKTGQCISMDHVCDGEMDCSDGSDEQGIFLFMGDNVSKHNLHLTNLSAKINQCHKLYDYQQPFGEFCDFQREFPCLLNNVADPIDILKNRPCVNLTRVGDGVADCYGALDEMNTFEDCRGTMKGFTFRCADMLTIWHCIDNAFLCDVRCKGGDDQPLCFYRSNILNCSAPMDAVCLNGEQCFKGGRCDGSLDCPYGEDEFWCPRVSSNFAKSYYRQGKHTLEVEKTLDFHIPTYPRLQHTLLSANPSQINSNKKFQLHRRIAQMNKTKNESNSLLRESFWCNRGVAVYVNNSIECLCPPSYYGDRCEYYSDRITVVTHLDISYYRLEDSIDNNTILKIVTNLLHEHNIIDFHEFYVQPGLEINEPVKQKFHLLYSRSERYLREKQGRQASRNQILYEHPYSIRFELYEQRANYVMAELGAWDYPIYFDFLPSYRFATILRFPNDYTNISINSCRKHRCLKNSICRPLFSKTNSYYCSCKQGYYGKHCQFRNEQCHVYCSAQSICKGGYRDQDIGIQRPLCICPRDRFGPRCNLRLNSFCPKDRCQNNGTCLYTYDWTGETHFRCVCQDPFHGARCEYEKTSVNIRINSTEVVPVTTMQLFDINRQTLQLEIRHQEVQSSLPTFIRYQYNEEYAPSLCLLKFYDDVHSSRYFIGYFQPSVTAINVTTKPLYCSLAQDYLQQLNMSKYIPLKTYCLFVLRI
ncbi:unnamed protein product [Rotaria socialis]